MKCLSQDRILCGSFKSLTDLPATVIDDLENLEVGQWQEGLLQPQALTLLLTGLQDVGLRTHRARLSIKQKDSVKVKKSLDMPVNRTRVIYNVNVTQYACQSKELQCTNKVVSNKVHVCKNKWVTAELYARIGYNCVCCLLLWKVAIWIIYTGMLHFQSCSCSECEK